MRNSKIKEENQRDQGKKQGNQEGYRGITWEDNGKPEDQ